MKNLVVLSGSGISKESGISTFRDTDGLWQEYDPRELATVEALLNNTEKVLEFYNLRRETMWNAEPNSAHLCLVSLEEKYNVQIITQNVDDLHERGGSSNILHLHGQLNQVRSSNNENIVKNVAKGEKVNIGDLAEDGSQLRPDVVLFGEPVPRMEEAIEITKKADILIVIGTSLQVYPAAELIEYTNENCETYIIDPEIPNISKRKNMYFLNSKATLGLPKLVQKLIEDL